MLRKLNRDQVHHGVKDASGCILLLYYRLQCYEMAINGKVEVRPMMYLALSYDHRIIDGKESVGFLVAVKEALENPEELLMSGNVERALEL